MEYLVIENVGNLICPGSCFLVEHVIVGMLSLPEGDDKVLKYPCLFSKIDTMLINKMDLTEYLKFDPDRAEKGCRSINPDVQVYRLSAETGQGMEALVSFIESRRKRNLTGEL